MINLPPTGWLVFSSVTYPLYTMLDLGSGFCWWQFAVVKLTLVSEKSWSRSMCSLLFSSYCVISVRGSVVPVQAWLMIKLTDN